MVTEMPADSPKLAPNWLARAKLAACFGKLARVGSNRLGASDKRTAPGARKQIDLFATKSAHSSARATAMHRLAPSDRREPPPRTYGIKLRAPLPAAVPVIYSRARRIQMKTARAGSLYFVMHQVN